MLTPVDNGLQPISPPCTLISRNSIPLKNPDMKSLQDELLDMAAQWKVDAVTVIEQSPSGSHAVIANQMLLTCADMLIEKIQKHLVESTSGLKS